LRKRLPILFHAPANALILATASLPDSDASPIPLSSVLLAHSATLVQESAASVIVHWALGASTPVTTHVDAVWL
jgi:hypothetical protein